MDKITATYIREQRINLGLTQKAFAEILSKHTGRKVTRDMIAQYECNRAWVPGDLILSIQANLQELKNQAAA